MKKLTRIERKEKRKMLRPWKGLTIWCILFALNFSIFTPMLHILDNDFMLVIPGSLWKMKNADPSAIYYPVGFDDEAEALAYGETVARQVSEEGIVLLTNETDALPLPQDSKVSLFSTSSVNPVMGGSGSGGVDSSSSDTMKEALEQEGITVNPLLWDFYDGIPARDMRSNFGFQSVTYRQYEAPWEDYTQEVLDSFPAYSDAAIVVLSRAGGQNSDIDYAPFNYLALDENEREMMRQVCQLRDEGVFDRVVVIINATNPLEMTFLQEFGVDACLLLGTPGQYGLNSLAEILVGKASPSGRLSDTWCYNNLAAPAMWNFTPVAYENAKEMGVPDNADTYQVYQEGIYVGYRYFETRYEDLVMGNGNAGSYQYDKTVAFPFGYGISYTDFRWENMTTHYDAQKDSFTVSVTVTNVGAYAGKDVVQIYARSPYTEYDKQNGVEKAAVTLCGYSKTKLLAPGESETLTIFVPKRELASFDAYGYGTYILEAGDYYLTAAKNAHEAVNNTLAARGYTPENTDGVMTGHGNAHMVYTWKQEETDTETYCISVSGGEITGKLAESDPNLYKGSDSTVTWLTRADWEGTFPKESAKMVLTAALAKDLQSNHYDPSQIDMTRYPMPTTGAVNGLRLYDMLGKPYDDPDWDLLLDQMSFDEMVDFIRDAFHGRSAIESVQAPGTRDENGPTGLNTSYVAGKQSATAFASPFVMGSTFNNELIRQVGYVIGNDCLRYGISALYGPGANTHRTAYGGRNFEYFSEDPFLSGEMAASYVGAVEKLGVNTLIKHFALNDCETDRQGLGVWLGEQAAREIYLKAFQKSFEEASANGVMAA
jgi:beta-glucosidase